MISDVAVFLFWFSIALVAYAYAGYPLLVRAVSRVYPHPVKKHAASVSVTFIIAAYNEEDTLGAKIENTLALHYPRDLLDIVVAADGSTDGTVRIAECYASRGVRVLHKPGREGKTSAINRAAETSSAEILFFSDANTFYNADAVIHMVKNFTDPGVGAVSGRKVVLTDSEREATGGEVAYWSYEAALKEAESRIGSIVTADGEIFAVRRRLFEPIPRHIVHDDMYLTLKIVAAGFRVVYEHEATSAEYASRTLWDEFHLKVRYASAGYPLVAAFPSLVLNPFRWFAWEFVSHKLLRWLAPLFLVTAFCSSAAASGPFYTTVFLIQAGFYLLAAAGALLHRSHGFLYFPLYFAVMNGAALYGLLRFLIKGQTPLWRKASR